MIQIYFFLIDIVPNIYIPPIMLTLCSKVRNIVLFVTVLQFYFYTSDVYDKKYITIFIDEEQYNEFENIVYEII